MFMLRRLEELPIGSFHYKMLLVTGLGWLFDAMDTGLIAFVLPLLVKDWGLSPAQAGWIGSVGLIGMALGAVVAGSLADRWGRKKVFTATVLLYSVSTGLCALLGAMNRCSSSVSSSVSASAANCPSPSRS